MNHSLDELAALDAQRILHPATSIVDLNKNGPRLITEGNGLYINDHKGAKQLDGIAGLWCVNVGYGRKELADAMAAAAQKLSFYHSFGGASNTYQIELADKLLAMAPDSLGKVFFGSSGSDANDTLIKIAWQYHYLRGNEQKRKVIAREQAYHGTSISTASLTGLPSFHKGFGLPMDGIVRVSCPHYWRFCANGQTEDDYCNQLINEISDRIDNEGADTIAAFIAEPIMAAGGVIPPPKGYFEKLHPLLKHHDILLIMDEVVCGYGRLGVNFGSNLYNVQPDMMATAKGLTSGYFPMSAAFISDTIWGELIEGSKKFGTFSHGYTYSGHPVGCAVGLANLEIIENEQLIANAKKTGSYLHQQLKQRLLQRPEVAEIRGLGLLAGIQLVENKDQRTLFDPSKKIPAQVANACMEAGLIIRPLPSIGALALSPPLTIKPKQIDFLIDCIEKSLNEVFR
ncbi:MAG: L-2,4-diaminobutyrate transaminase/4-aminobutyrate--pyruvate transaminase [Pseudohongiellaceae bacterium]|jgi:L-2,4-diaminobutyrate transaminase/4-aminobutyrate--pyruvate transaminase